MKYILKIAEKREELNFLLDKLYVFILNIWHSFNMEDVKNGYSTHAAISAEPCPNWYDLLRKKRIN